MKNYSITTPDALGNLCVKKEWFTHGSHRQYDNMLRMNEQLAPIEEIATLIWLCSDNEEWCKQDIITELKLAKKDYLTSLDEQKTQGRKGYKMQRINMAFTPDNIQFIRDMSKAKGMTMTQYVNGVLNKEREKNSNYLKTLKDFAKRYRDG